MPDSKKRVLVVDDAPAVVELIQDHLEAQEFHVTGVHSGSEALAQLAEHPFDVLVVDVVMPEMSGYDLVSRIRELRVHTPVLMLTGKGEVEDVVHGLEVGADDYLTKPFHMAELSARIEALIRRNRSGAGAPIEFEDVRLDPVAREVTRGDRVVDLTHREFDILHHFMKRAPEVVSRDELLREVWGVDFDPGTNVVEVHIFNLRRKTESAGELRVIQTVRGEGYRLALGETGDPAP